MLEEIGKICIILVPPAVFTLLVLALTLGVVKSMVTDADAASGERPVTRAERQHNPFGLPDHIARLVIDLGEIRPTYDPLRRCVGLWCTTCGMPRCSRGERCKPQRSPRPHRSAEDEPYRGAAV